MPRPFDTVCDKSRTISKPPAAGLNVKARKPWRKIRAHVADIVMFQQANRASNRAVDQQDVSRRNRVRTKAYPRPQLVNVLINGCKSAYMAPLGVMEPGQHDELIEMVGKGSDDHIHSGLILFLGLCRDPGADLLKQASCFGHMPHFDYFAIDNPIYGYPRILKNAAYGSLNATTESPRLVLSLPWPPAAITMYCSPLLP